MSVNPKIPIKYKFDVVNLQNMKKIKWYEYLHETVKRYFFLVIGQ